MPSSGTDCPRTSAAPLAIVVLAGGWSSERQVSLASGRAVADALRSIGHDIRELDPAAIDLPTYPWVGIDAAFIALHGTFGEDGTVQSLLDDLKIPYTGSGAAASRLAMDKSASKQRLLARNVPTPPYARVHVNDSHQRVHAAVAELTFPVVVKPNAQGSSVGVTIVSEASELEDAVQTAFRYDPIALIERFVPGREVTVAVWDRRALPVIEIQPARAFFDYKAKYLDDATQYAFDTDLAPNVVQQIESVAIAAVESLGCAGMARVDLRIDHAFQPWVLEVNTVPGFTNHSLVPKAAARAGIPFARMCEQMVFEAVERTSRPVTQRAA